MMTFMSQRRRLLYPLPHNEELNMHLLLHLLVHNHHNNNILPSSSNISISVLPPLVLPKIFWEIITKIHPCLLRDTPVKEIYLATLHQHQYRRIRMDMGVKVKEAFWT